MDGPRTFENGKTRLDAAIREYDQAVFHLAARAVTDLKYQQEMGQKQKKDEELLQWLSGPFESPWLVEGQLSLFRRQRAEATLEWARDMPEFQTWRLSSTDNRFLWIRGTLGVGKSIMAAYFIDLLKCHYPNAVVAYFFCRSNQPGLTKARDVIRTLAYQCTENDDDAHQILHALKRKGFGISENQEVDFLLEKLLLDPLRGTRKEIYIVLDGVDEADMITSNKFDRSDTPEMHVLLKSLTKLPSVRLLFISRATANICNIVPNTKVKEIGKSENAQDIKKYVRDVIAKSNQLQTLFRNEKKDPVKYFEDKADGIFLWVVLVIQQLEKAKTQSNFRKYLEGFSEASGSMERLYKSILLTIHEEYQKCVKEIIRWIVVAETRLSVDDLKTVVEFSVNDNFADFEEFLKVDCGSILQLIPDTNGPDGVQLIHETFRSFVLKPEECPPTFLVVEVETHGHVAINCLKFLSTSDGLDAINDYWTRYWTSHLSKATSPRQSKVLLVNLHIFFTSAGLKTWIKSLERYSPTVIGRPRPTMIGLQIHSEEEPLRQVREWLGTCRLDGEDGFYLENGQGDDRPELVESAVNWRRTALGSVYALGESIGKAAARIWLYEALDQSQPLRTCFCLALKYFWRRPNRTEANRDELNKLVNTRFKAISLWAEVEEDHEGFVNKNIALAFLIIYKWDDCIRCFNADDDDKFMEVLAMAYMAKRDFDKAIDILKTTVAVHPTEIHLLHYLSNAYLGNGDYELAIKALEMVVEIELDEYSIMNGVWEACDRVGNYDSAIKIFNIVASKRPNLGILWYYLGLAWAAKGDINGFVETFRMAIEKYPKERALLSYISYIPNFAPNPDSSILSQIDALVHDKHQDKITILAIVYAANKNFDRAFKVLETAMYEGPGIEWRHILFMVCEKKGDYDGALKMVEAALEDRPTNPELLMFLGNAFMAKRDYKRAINSFERAIQGDDSYRMDTSRIHLFSAYKLNQDYEAAIKFIKSINGKSNVRNLLESQLLEIYYAKGDYDGAIALFECLVNSSHRFEPWVWSPLLKAYVAKSGYKVAIKRIETAINESQIALSLSLAYRILETFETAEDYIGAIAWFRGVVDSHPTDGWAWNVLADAYIAGGQYYKAVDLYHTAIKQISIDYSFYLRLGDVYFAMSDEKSALDAYSQAINMAGTPVFQFAYIDMRANLDPYLWESPEITIDTNLRRSFLWYSLGEIHKRTRDYDAAAKVYKSAVTFYKRSIERDDEMLLLQYSEIVECAGSFDVFQKFSLHKVVLWSTLGHKAVLWSALGEVYRTMGELADSLLAFRKALEIKPENRWLQSMIQKLAAEIQQTPLEDEIT